MKKIFLSLIALIALIALGLFLFFKSTVPNYSEELKLDGLKSVVKVHYDKYAIPHIYANNDEDAYMALGYVHAKERLFQMELLKRVGSGRLSEMFGPDLLEVDKLFRTVGIGDQSAINADHYKKEGGHMMKMTESYLRGVNYFIENGPTPLEYSILGIEKEKFDLKAMFDIAGYMGYSFALAHRVDPLLSKIERELGPEYLKDVKYTWPKNHPKIPVYDSLINRKEALGFKEDWVGVLQRNGIPIWEGSNSWAVNSKKAKGDKPILCNDTHISYGQPHIWYESHMEYPGFKIYGNYLCGVPLPLIGHNDFCAWGLTMFQNDDMDLYEEKQLESNDSFYVYKDSILAFDFKEELIKIKGEDPYNLTIRSSVHGPIVNEVYKDVKAVTDAPVSFWWTYTQTPSSTLKGFWELSHCQSIEEAELAASLIDAPGVNMMYADIEDNIAWWACGRLVKRPDHVNSLTLLEGWTGRDDALGYYDFSYNPKSINPPTNYVYSANNQPDTNNSVYYPGYYVSGHRADRITELLEIDDPFDVEKMKEMLNDTKVNFHRNVAKRICTIIENEVEAVNDSIVKQAHDVLSKWDGSHGLDDLGPSIFYNTLYKSMYYAFVDEIGLQSFKSFLQTHVFKKSFPALFENPNSKWWDDIETEKTVESQETIVWRSFYKAVDFLSRNFGKDVNEWKWSKMHQIEHKHPIGKVKPLNYIFNVGPGPVKGGFESINNVSINLNDTVSYEVNHGPAMRIIIDFENLESGLSVIPSGQSGHAFSPHYDDQFEMYNLGLFRLMDMNKERIVKRQKYEMELRP